MAEWSGGSGSRDGGGFRKGYPLGEWKERITIQRSSLGNDKAGNHVLVWEDYFCCSAFVNSLSGKEYWEAAQVNAQRDIYLWTGWRMSLWRGLRSMRSLPRT